MRISASNVGIGLGGSNPIATLEVNSDWEDVVAHFVSSDANAAISLQDNATTAGTGNVGIRATGNDLVFLSGGSAKMYLLSGGNFGIGVATPTSNLHVVGPAPSSQPTVNIVNTDNTTTNALGLSVQAGGNSTDSGYQLRTLDMDGNVDFFIRGDGKIGMGTTSPSGSLHISGGGDTALYIETNNLGNNRSLSIS